MLEPVPQAIANRVELPQPGSKAFQDLSAPRQFSARTMRLSNGDYAVPVQDLTPAMHRYHVELIRKNYPVYGITAGREVIESEAWLLIPDGRLALDRIIAFLQNGLATPDLAQLPERENNLRRRLGQALAVSSPQATENDYVRLFHLMTSYGALFLDSVIGQCLYEYLHGVLKYCPNVPFDSSMTSLQMSMNHPTREPSFFVPVWDRLLVLVEREMRGKLRSAAVTAFTVNFGYLDRNDILPCALENHAHVTNLIRTTADSLSDPDDLKIMRAQLRVSGEKVLKQQQQFRELVRQTVATVLSARQTDLALNIIECAHNYDQANHRMRTQFLKFTQSWLENHGYDPRTAELPEGCRQLPPQEEIQNYFAP